MNFQDLLNHLPHLSPSQLMDLKRRVNTLLNLQGIQEDKASVDDDWLLFGIEEYLRSEVKGVTIVPFSVLQKQQHYKAYANKAVEIRALVEKSVPGMSKNEKRAMGILLSRALGRLLDTWSVTVNQSSMMQFIKYVPDALDQSFPGYLQSGHLSLLIKSGRRMLEIGQTEER